MITSTEIQAIRDADPDAVLPGIDTKTGNPDSTSSLLPATKITQENTAPYFYAPSRNAVYVTQNGAVLSGINFGTASVIIGANNVTIKDCTFTGTASYWGVLQESNSGATVENCTFQGSKSPTEFDVPIGSSLAITIKDNSFLDSPGDAIDIGAGVVTGNYFSGQGYETGAHADAIQMLESTGPTTITDNFIDGTPSAGAPAEENNDLRLTSAKGDLSNVTASGNFLIGGGWTVAVGGAYRTSDASITNNVIGFWKYGPYYPGTTSNARVTGNTLVATLGGNTIVDSNSASASAITGISASPANGDLNAGKTVALTLGFSENVTVAGGTPTLTLNDGGKATYASGSGTKDLTFTYTVAAGQNTASLAATAVNLPSGVTIEDIAGNAANLSLTGLAQHGPQIDTVTPKTTSLVVSPANGDLNAGKTVALTLAFSENVTVAGGEPTLALNDGGKATYASGSGTKDLTFDYTVAAGQDTASLAATAVNLPSGVTIDDGAGNAANLSLAGLAQHGPQIDTVTPKATSLVASPAHGDLKAGRTVTLTLGFSENVTVAGGKPTLTLNDGGKATYASGSGTKDLTFDYTVAAGQDTASLAATAVNLPGGVTIEDDAGNAANLSLAGLAQHGPKIDTEHDNGHSLLNAHSHPNGHSLTNGHDPAHSSLDLAMFDYLNGRTSQAAEVPPLLPHASHEASRLTLTDSHSDNLTLKGYR